MNDLDMFLNIASKKQVVEKGFLYSFNQGQISFLSRESTLEVLILAGYCDDYREVMIQYDQYQGAYELKRISKTLGANSGDLFLLIIQFIKSETIDNSDNLHPM